MGFKKQVYQIDLRSHLPFVRVNGFQRQVLHWPGFLSLWFVIWRASEGKCVEVTWVLIPMFVCRTGFGKQGYIEYTRVLFFFLAPNPGGKVFFPSETVFPCARAGCAACRFHLVMARCRRWTFRKGIRKFRRHVFVEHFWFAISAFVR